LWAGRLIANYLFPNSLKRLLLHFPTSLLSIQSVALSNFRAQIRSKLFGSKTAGKLPDFKDF
jgi:hypothetical protein